MTGGELLGRDAERAAIGALLDRARGGDSGALVVLGPAGAGKTTLVRDALRIAAESDPPPTVLRARGIESEAEVAFAGLLELVRPLMSLIPRLPEPQARALEGALALVPVESTDRFSVSAATLAILSLAAADRPLLVLVDDLHWLDPPSAQAILFAARRLLHEGVAILLSSRPEHDVMGQIEGLPVLEVRPLGAEQAAELARSVASRDLGSDEVEALVAGTGGNPLAIVEAAREVGRPGSSPASVFLPLPVADRIRVGVERRLAALDDLERRAVLIAATAGNRAPCALVDRALAVLGSSLDALDAAECAGVLQVRNDVVEFEHPLTRSAAYALAGSRARRTAHGALASTLPAGSAERAWHLAAAAVGPDAEAAAALEMAGQDALARGAPSTAGRAFDRAAALSADPEAAARRLLLSGDAARLAGSPDHAREVITRALESSGDPLMRADALGLLFEMDTWRAPVATARSIAAEAARLAEVDRTRAARMLAEAAAALARSGSISQGVEFAERAYAQITDQGLTDDTVELALLFARVMDARAPEAVEPLVALGERLLSMPPSAHTLALLQQVAWIETWVERYAAAGVLLDHAVAVGRSQAPGTLPMALATRAELWFRLGQFHQALADTTEAASLAADFAQPHPRGLALTCQARIQACIGGDSACRTAAEDAARIGSELGGADSPIASWGAPALGLLELARGRPEAAIPHLEKLVRSFRRGGIREPGVVLAAGDLIEAYAKSGRVDDGRTLLDDFGALARRTERIGAQAIAERCRGLLTSGDTGAFEEALRLHALVDRPFERARTLLVFGEVLRAAGRADEAAPRLRHALATFQRLGAEPWVETAHRDLEGIGGAAARRPVDVSRRLTPRELRVAQVAASGATGDEAGAQLFVSAKTVEAHLARIYRKLGVRSRDELAERVTSAGSDRARALVITSFGRFSVIRDGRVLGDAELGGEHGRRALAALLAARGPVPHETLAAWAAGESVAEVDGQALDEALDAIELALGVGRVSRDGGSVAMVLGDGAEWDVLRLLDAAAGAVADDCSPEALDTMLADFSAPLFPEWPGAAWAGELDAACAAALGALRGRLADCLLRRGRHQEALGHYLALCEAEPDQESWHRGVMRCHSAAGHIALALRQYHACRSAVRQQRGQDPDPETRDLYMELLAGR
jgi:DNA-binding CsgD family transcriptional regulator